MDPMLVFKGTLLLALALLGERLLHRSPAARRHQFWSVAFAAVLALPLVASTLPVIPVSVPATLREIAQRHVVVQPAQPGPAVPATAAEDRAPRGVIGPDPLLARASAVPLRDPRASMLSTAGTVFGAIWLAGAIAAGTALLLSFVRVRELARSAQEVRAPGWLAAAAAVRVRLGMRRPARLVVSAAVRTPMAGGLWRPIVFLPADAATWNEERRDVVLAHEFAHLARQDPLRLLVMRMAVVFYWFHPLAWLAVRQATAAREQACDEAVLALGTRPSAYARVLVELAESMHAPSAPLGALAMVERSLLEARVMTILSPEVRPATVRSVSIPAIVLAVLTVGIAVAQPADPEAAVSVGPTAIVTAGPAFAPVVTPGLPIAGSAGLPERTSQPSVSRESACWWEPSDHSSFAGTSSTTVAGGRLVIVEQIGTRGTDRVIQKSFGDMRLCMVAEGLGNRADGERPSQWPSRARRVVMEAHLAGKVQRLEIEAAASGTPRTSWRVGSVERAFDADVQRWRDRLLAVFDTTWEVAALRGRVSTLHGEISSILGQESSLRGEMSSLVGEVSSMQGRVSAIQGEQSSLQGQISSIQGHVSSLRGAISSEQGAISSLNASPYRWDDAGRAGTRRIREHNAEIARIEKALAAYDADAKIAVVEREIAALDAGDKVAALEAQIRAFALDAKVAAVERRIVDLDVQGKVAAIERQIAALDAERRTRQLEERRDLELLELEKAIAALRQ